MLNQYFTQKGHLSEQSLLDDLTAECIQIHGLDWTYIERDKITDDALFGESPVSEFQKFHQIEMYIENVDGLEGDNEFISQFGLEIHDSATLVVNRRRFQAATCLDFPKEGDLIFSPMTNKLFEINFIDKDDPFFQLGKNYTWKLKIELFDYNHQDITTGSEEIDSLGINSVLDIDDIINDSVHATNSEIEEISEETKETQEDSVFGKY